MVKRDPLRDAPADVPEPTELETLRDLVNPSGPGGMRGPRESHPWTSVRVFATSYAAKRDVRFWLPELLARPDRVAA